MTAPSLRARVIAETLGTAYLVMGVVGSGIMAERLSGGNVAVALLANSLATGAVLAVLITVLAPISGAQFNPLVSFAALRGRQMAASEAAAYAIAQVAGAVAGVWASHAMFDLPILQVSQHARGGFGALFAEFIATFGLLFTILTLSRQRAALIPAMVGLYIGGAYWFTASTSFANPAVTFARAWTATFAGIAPADVVPFIVAQIVGMVAAVLVAERVNSAQEA